MNAGSLSVLLLCASVAAQTTWIVNPGGGPGVHFTDLPAAVAAANDGDTIRVQPGPFLAGVSGFSTSKGLTIVGENQVTIGTWPTAVLIANLPAGRQFRMAGFDAPRGQELRIVVQDCIGEVHLENLHAVEPGMFFPTGAAIRITDSDLVTMRDVEEFGNPAVAADRSTVVLVKCRLGLTTLGLGGGPGVVAVDSVVDVSEPFFQTGWAPVGIEVLRCQLRIGGSANARIAAGDPQFATPGTPIAATNSNVTVDPAVPLFASPATSPAIVHTGSTVAAQFVPATWSSRAIAGQSVVIHATHPANALVLQFVGFPGPATATPFGTAMVALAPSPVWLVAVHAPVGAGAVTTPIALPAWATGVGLAAQSFVIHTAAELGTATVFVVH